MNVDDKELKMAITALISGFIPFFIDLGYNVNPNF